MRGYAMRRLLFAVPTFLVVTAIVFLAIRFIPGSTVDLMVAEMSEVGTSDNIDREAIESALGLDMPIHIQYGRWLGILPQEEGSFSGLLQGDLGDSLWSGSTVISEIIPRIPVSLELGLFGLLIGLTLALPIGVYSAIRQDTIGDYIARTIAILFISLPTFWVGTMVIIYPSVWWGVSPSMELISFFDDPVGNLAQFALPAFILGMYMSGSTMRMTRTMMLEVLRQDYTRTAWSKGLTERRVILAHTLKNALIPVVTLVGIMVPLLVGGTVVLEQIFSLPGMGRVLIGALTLRDYPIISGLNVILASVVLMVNLVVDLTYAYLDPRIKYE